MLLDSDKEKDVLVAACWPGGLRNPPVFLHFAVGCLRGQEVSLSVLCSG